MLFNFLLGFTFMLRGRDEYHELLWIFFSFSRIISGKYIGRHKFEIDKTVKVTTENIEIRDNRGYLSAIECTDNPSTYVVRGLLL